MDRILPILIAAGSGGLLVKVFDYFTTRGSSERDNLRNDIVFLRSEIDKLRGRVDALECENTRQRAQLSIWQRVYWQLKTRADRIVDYLIDSPDFLSDREDLVRLIERYQDCEGVDNGVDGA